MRRRSGSRRNIRLRRRRALARRRRRSPSGVDARVRGAGRDRASFMMSTSALTVSQVMPWMWSRTDAGGCRLKGPETRMRWKTDRRNSHRWNTARSDSRIPCPAATALDLVPAPPRGRVPGSKPASARAQGRRGLHREAVAYSTHLSASRESPPERRCSGACSTSCACRAGCVRPAGHGGWWWMSQPAVHPEEHAVRPDRVHGRTWRSSLQTSRPRRPPPAQGTPASDAENACAPSTVAPALPDATGG